MKILTVCPCFYPESGRLENYIYNISKGLVKKRFVIRFIHNTVEYYNHRTSIKNYFIQLCRYAFEITLFNKIHKDILKILD